MTDLTKRMTCFAAISSPGRSLQSGSRIKWVSPTQRSFGRYGKAEPGWECVPPKIFHPIPQRFGCAPPAERHGIRGNSAQNAARPDFRNRKGGSVPADIAAELQSVRPAAVPNQTMCALHAAGLLQMLLPLRHSVPNAAVSSGRTENRAVHDSHRRRFISAPQTKQLHAAAPSFWKRSRSALPLGCILPRAGTLSLPGFCALRLRRGSESVRAFRVLRSSS